MESIPGTTREEIVKLLEEVGIKPTSNRILVIKEICRSDMPISLLELESAIDTLDKSSISRVLNLLMGSGILHALEDGRGVTRYELCLDHSADRSHASHMHAHFYCENCRKVYCLDNITIPKVSLPDGFEVSSVNFMLKGKCPECS